MRQGAARPADTIVEGITVGWGDNYPANIEGQYIDITGIAPGRYLLVHRIRAGGLLEMISVQRRLVRRDRAEGAGLRRAPPPTVVVARSGKQCDSTYSRWGIPAAEARRLR